MLCSISGEVPQTPVISSKTGHVFEQRLLEKYLAENDGRCPITNQQLSPEDIVAVKEASGLVAPRPPTLTSIPSLLSVFQNEWDSLMLEVFTLKQQYQQVRQQLSHALYQNDSSARVIARLLEERDEARQALADLKSHIGAPSGRNESTEISNGASEENSGMTGEVLEILEKTSKELSKGRKKRTLPQELIKSEEICSFGLVKTISSLHSQENSGVNKLQVAGSYVATCGNDGNIQIYNLEDDVVVCNFSAHSAGVTELVWDDESTRLFSTSTDNVIRCWNPSTQNDFSSWDMVGELPQHGAQVTSFCLNPCRRFAASTSLDSTWRFYDIHAGQILASLTNPNNTSFTCGQFHPDGALFGAGTADSTVQIWSVKDQSKAADFDGHTGAITSLSFSENGYFLATTSENNEVKLWDLRKLVNFETITMPSNCAKVTFDLYGSYLAAASTDSISIFKAKSWKEPLVTISASISDMKFSNNSSSLLTVSSEDSNLRIFGMTS